VRTVVVHHQVDVELFGNGLVHPVGIENSKFSLLAARAAEHRQPSGWSVTSRSALAVLASALTWAGQSH
jgi:hypothetical protein